MSAPPIPMVVVGGYLGAGKTTLLNALLADADGQRIAVLVNDFGSVNIDAALIRQRSADVIQLENGCICCSIGDRLAEALSAIAARRERPDLLVIEASGVSDPMRIAQVGLLDHAFRLNAIIVAVDVQHVHETLADRYVGDMAHQQIASATVLALTHTDLASRAVTDRAARSAITLAPQATLLRTRMGKLPLAVFVDVIRPPWSTGLRTVPLSQQHGTDHGGITTFTHVTTRVFDKQWLRQTLREFPVPLLRVKGIIRLAGHAQPKVLHVVGGRIALSPYEGRCDEHSTLVFIGRLSRSDEDAIRLLLS